MEDGKNGYGSFLKGLLIGGCAGAAAAILFAAKSGKELRSDITEQGNKAFEETKRFCIDTKDKAKAVFEGARQGVEELKKGARSA